MKRAGFNVCVGKKNGYDIYRAVYIQDGHYFVKMDKQLHNVDHLVAQRFSSKELKGV